ncbi:hypothetical protein, partial [Xanthomonas hortorum]|uniref:hypothetical protein n=1 Tax=Xanthomonas hortorum TaxID=56454 RepID=UPI001CA58FAE
SEEKAALAGAVFSFSASAHYTGGLPRCFGTSGAESTFLQERAYSQERWWTVRGHQNRIGRSGNRQALRPPRTAHHRTGELNKSASIGRWALARSCHLDRFDVPNR